MAMKFKVNPSRTHNSLLNAANRDAAYKQDDADHWRTLNQFVTPGMDPATRALAEQAGEMAEGALPEYWNEDTMPRRELNLGSSFIENIDYLPALQLARIMMNGKIYDFPAFSPKDMGDMLTSPSLGTYLWDHDRFIQKHRR